MKLKIMHEHASVRSCKGPEGHRTHHARGSHRAVPQTQTMKNSPAKSGAAPCRARMGLRQK